MLNYPAVLFSLPFGAECPRGRYHSGDNLNSAGGVPIDIRPCIAGFSGSAEVLAWILASCSTIPRSFSVGLSMLSVPWGAINSGGNLYSVGGVPVDIRPRNDGF
jgi:hypothetical protein